MAFGEMTVEAKSLGESLQRVITPTERKRNLAPCEFRIDFVCTNCERDLYYWVGKGNTLPTGSELNDFLLDNEWEVTPNGSILCNDCREELTDDEIADIGGTGECDCGDRNCPWTNT